MGASFLYGAIEQTIPNLMSGDKYLDIRMFIIVEFIMSKK